MCYLITAIVDVVSVLGLAACDTVRISTFFYEILRNNLQQGHRVLSCMLGKGKG